MDKENLIVSDQVSELLSEGSEIFKMYMQCGHNAMFSMFASEAFKKGFACGWNSRGQVKTAAGR